MNIESIPIKLAKIYTKAKNLLVSNTSGYQIAKYSGINHSTIYRLREHKRSINSLTLKSLLLLANYPNKGIINKFNHRVDPIKYRYYLSTAATNLGVNFEELESRIAEVTTSTNNLSELSRHLHIARTHLSHMRYGQYNILYLSASDAIKMDAYWIHLRKIGVIKKSSRSRL